jgi:hypothetical protein
MKQFNMKETVGKTVLLSLAVTQITIHTSCVKESLYNTDHPEYGKIELTTTWEDCGEWVDIPGSYTAQIGSHTETLSGEMNTIDYFFDEGNLSLHVYNVVNGITVDGETAMARYPSAWAGSDIGWFFTGSYNVAIEKDKLHEITVPMKQQVRQLTLELELAGDAKERITGIEATLSGVAGAINITSGNPAGDAVTVTPEFTQINGEYSATMRLLGVTNNAQILSLTLQFADGIPSTYTVVSDLSSRLATFNTGKRMPLVLYSILVVTPTAGGFTATITPWTEDSGNAIAD